MYTNSWDPNNGQILISTDQGKTFTPSSLPFKVGGNMPGRGMGEVRYRIECCVPLLSFAGHHSVSPLTRTATTSFCSVHAAEKASGSRPTLVHRGHKSETSLASVRPCTTWYASGLDTPSLQVHTFQIQRIHQGTTMT